MSLLGSVNDWLSGNPDGTADQTAADLAAAEARARAASAQQLAQGKISQANFDATQEAIDEGTDPNSVLAGLELSAAGLEGAVQAAGDPAQVLSTGATFEGQLVGQAAGAAANAAAAGAKAGASSFFGSITLTTWVVLIALVGLFFYFGGIQRRARKVFS